MRKLLEIPYNVFTPKIIDIIAPGCSFIKSDSYTEFHHLVDKENNPIINPEDQDMS